MPEATHTATSPSSEISKALALRHGADDRICVNAYTRNGDGKFHPIEDFVDGVEAAERIIEGKALLPEVGAIWTNLQRLQPGATQRSPENVIAYTNLLIDIDRRDKKNPDGTHNNATDAEREVLLEQSYGIITFLKAHFEHPVHADSGNGYHLEYALASLAPEIGHQYHETILKIIKARFERRDLNMAIDTSISNHTRVITVWGTWNRKYPHTEERPQRQTKILSYPQTLRPLSENRLDGFCLENKVIVLPAAARGAAKTKGDWPLVDPQWLENYGVEHLCEWGMPFTPLQGNSEKGSKTYYWLGNCITSDKCIDGFHQHHEGANLRQTALILGDTLGVECFSDDCTEYTLRDWLRRLEELKGEKYPYRIFLDDGPELAAWLGAESSEEEAEELAEEEEPATEAGSGKLKYAELVPDIEAICPQGTKFRELVQDACRGGALTGNKEWAMPPGLVIECILALASAVPRQDRMLDVRINRFSCLLAISRGGKGVSYRRSARVLGLGMRDEEPDGIMWMNYNPGGHSQMVMMLGDTAEKKSKENPNPATHPGPKRMFGLSTELGVLLKSAKGESSHMLDTFNQFHDSNHHQTRERNTNRLVQMDCRFSWGTSLARA